MLDCKKEGASEVSLKGRKRETVGAKERKKKKTIFRAIEEERDKKR